MPTFQPPVRFTRSPVYVGGQDRYYPATPFGPAQRLMAHFGGQPVGVSVLKINGSYVTIETPTGDQIDSATEVYLGGHVYDVSQAVADALTAAGYTVGG